MAGTNLSDVRSELAGRVKNPQALLTDQDWGTVIINKFSTWLAVISMVSMFIIIVSTNVDVFLRFLFTSSVPGNVNLCEGLMVLAVFLGLPITELTGNNVKMEVIFDRLPRRLQPGMVLFDRLLCFLILAFLTYASISYAITQFVQGEVMLASTTQIELWPARFSLALGIAVLCFIILVETVKVTILIFRREKKG